MNQLEALLEPNRPKRRRRPLPASTVVGPLRRISSSRKLTREELAAVGREMAWSLALLTCGHEVIRMLHGQQSARCGFCAEERDQLASDG